MTAEQAFLDVLEALSERLRRRMAFYGLHTYRIVSQNGARLTLQAVNEADARRLRLPVAPEIDKLPAAQGISETCQLGGLVLLGFQRGDAGAPFVAFYEPMLPQQLTIDGTTVHVGPSGDVQLAGGSTPIALATPVAALASALSTFASAAGAAVNVAQVAAAATALSGALAGISTYAATRVTGQ